jgi:hypothetical protein
MMLFCSSTATVPADACGANTWPVRSSSLMARLAPICTGKK